MSKKRVLTLRLKEKWWNQIKCGEKTEELRVATDYWRKRIVGREYDEIHLWMGYPPKTDVHRLIRREWDGYEERVIVHEEFGDEEVVVLAIDVSQPVED